MVEEDEWPLLREKPEWRREGGKGRWVLRLATGDHAVATFDDTSWRVEVIRSGKVPKAKSFKDFQKACVWGEKELVGRPTAWERL
jgi:hypothetical protein